MPSLNPLRLCAILLAALCCHSTVCAQHYSFRRGLQEDEDTTSSVAATATNTSGDAVRELCFESTPELKRAVNAYLWDSSNNTELARTYGWPIGSWCVDQIENFNALFSIFRNPRAGLFNEDLSGWNISSARSMDRMFLFAGSFQQELCSWAETIQDMRRPPSTNRMFLGTACPNTESLLDGSGSLPESFCSDCSLELPPSPAPSTTGEITAAPSRSPPIPSTSPSDSSTVEPTDAPSNAPIAGAPTLSPSLLYSPTVLPAPSLPPTLTPTGCYDDFHIIFMLVRLVDGTPEDLQAFSDGDTIGPLDATMNVRFHAMNGDTPLPYHPLKVYVDGHPGMGFIDSEPKMLDDSLLDLFRESGEREIGGVIRYSNLNCYGREFQSSIKVFVLGP